MYRLTDVIHRTVAANNVHKQTGVYELTGACRVEKPRYDTYIYMLLYCSELNVKCCRVMGLVKGQILISSESSNVLTKLMKCRQLRYTLFGPHWETHSLCY